ncbi:DUF433 domain-containing protein [Thermus thalpophilus]|uniref:DUF433 domain-containing protein n=1 Tax=Thermus thalpophilus TaxID=2908147 RepID=UPI001FA9F569|nr:DUF433 domain-containing protein [Thermus thalpophilus]
MALSERVPVATNEAGDLHLKGRRVFLEDPLELHRQGRSPEAIAGAYPGLALADVHAALAWTLRHLEEVEAYLERQRARSGEAEERTHPHRSLTLRRRLEACGG